MCELCLKRSLGLPAKKTKWEIEEHTVGVSIHVYAHGGMIVLRGASGLDPSATWVKEPNRIERFFGATIEKRLKNARKKAQRTCDKQKSR